MPTSTYIALATTTLSSITSSVTFSSIPNTYRDLILVAGGRVSSGSGAFIRFNGDMGANYSMIFMFSQGAGRYSEQYANQTEIGIGAFQPSGLNIHHIMDYSAADRHKGVIVRRDTPEYTTTGLGRWANNSPINSITFGATQMSPGMVISLYGIAG